MFIPGPYTRVLRGHILRARRAEFAESVRTSRLDVRRHDVRPTRLCASGDVGLADTRVTAVILWYRRVDGGHAARIAGGIGVPRGPFFPINQATPAVVDVDVLYFAGR